MSTYCMLRLCVRYWGYKNEAPDLKGLSPTGQSDNNALISV